MLLDQLAKVISFLTSNSQSGYRNGNNIQKFVDAIKVREEGGRERREGRLGKRGEE